MKLYKAKHRPTGLFYCPSRRVKQKKADRPPFSHKSNLSEKGKFYRYPPPAWWLNSIFIDGHFVKNRAEDFELVIFYAEQKREKVD